MADPKPNRLKRRLTSPAGLDFFTSSASSFHPRPYQPSPSSAPPPKPPPPARNNSLTHPLPPMDPTPGEPNTVFIHPPFFDFPDSHLYPDGLTYTVMAMNPDWFLDSTDFTSMHASSNPNAIPYPPQLEPPRGWCPAKKKDLKERGAEGWPDGEEPRLRCTFCRRTYAGVNAKSMWRRHVFEKHKIAMSNRRENVERSRKGGQEKENLSVSRRSNDHQATKSRLRSLRPAASTGSSALFDRNTDNDSDVDDDPPVPSAPRVPQGHFPSLDPAPELSRPPLSKAESQDSATPPPNSPRSTTPDIAPLQREASLSPPRPVIPISPYNPLTTPSFRHSPPRLPSDQPWRYPSPSHPLHFTALDVSLGMVVRGQGSPSGAMGAPSALDVSPVIIAPRDGKSSVFSTPSVVLFGRKDPGRSATKPTPRRLFLSGSLPTPITERLSFERSRPLEESPLRRIGGRHTPRGPKVMFTPARTKMSNVSVRSAATLEDPFGNLDPSMSGLGKSLPGSSIATPPMSSPDVDSPVVRTGRYLNTDGLAKSSSSRDHNIGLGLLEAFTLKQRQEMAENEDDGEIDTMLMSSPVVRARSSSARDFVFNSVSDREDDNQCSPSLQPPVRKRRKTVSEHI